MCYLVITPSRRRCGRRRRPRPWWRTSPRSTTPRSRSKRIPRRRRTSNPNPHPHPSPSPLTAHRSPLTFHPHPTPNPHQGGGGHVRAEARPRQASHERSRLGGRQVRYLVITPRHPARRVPGGSRASSTYSILYSTYYTPYPYQVGAEHRRPAGSARDITGRPPACRRLRESLGRTLTPHPHPSPLTLTLTLTLTR